MKAKLFISVLLISVAGFAQSPDSVLIRGQVISRDNYPLPYASVGVSHTDITVRTDLEGQFEIWAPVEGILEFSCISEPYRLGLSDIGIPKEGELIRFKFDLKHFRTNYKTKKQKGKTLRIKKVQTFSDIILAYYDSDFERITQKNYKYHSSQGRKIIFMIDGQIMSEDFTLSDLDFSNFRKTAILRILDSADKIIFMISTKA